jgi:hypothetical protein
VRHRATKRLSLLAWAALLVACGPRPGAETAADLQLASLGEPATAALVVGCWTLDWGGGVGRAPDGTGVLPDSIRLRDEAVFATPERLVTPATHPTGRRAVDGGDTPWEMLYLLNRWWIDDEMLRLRFTDGERERWDVVMAVKAGQLTGAARYEGEAGPAGGRQDLGVGARRIDCAFE